MHQRPKKLIKSARYTYIFKIHVRKFFSSMKNSKNAFSTLFSVLFCLVSVTIRIQTNVLAGKSILYWLHALDIMRPLNILLGEKHQSHCEIFCVLTILFSNRQTDKKLYIYFVHILNFLFASVATLLHFNSHFVYCLP